MIKVPHRVTHCNLGAELTGFLIERDMIQTSAEAFVHGNDTDALPTWGSVGGEVIHLTPV